MVIMHNNMMIPNIINDYDISYDINDQIRKLSNLYPNYLWKMVERVIPAGVDTSYSGIEISSPILFRNRFDYDLFKMRVGYAPGAPSGCIQFDAFNDRKQSKTSLFDLLPNGPDIISAVWDADINLNDSIDIIVCNAILQYVVKPSQVIQEFNRVLKKGGKIWIEVPSIQPLTYINKHVGFDDLWRFSLKGIETTVADHFKTIQIGYSRVRNSYLNFGVYYYGEKI